MSVAGFDIGNNASCVAVARNRGIDVLMNKESKRETPTVVSFGDKMRFLGTEGAAKITMNIKNTVSQIKRIVGRSFDDPDVQEDIKKFPFKVIKGDDGGCLVQVMFANEVQKFAPEQLIAMNLVDLKNIAYLDAGTNVVDCVISVPVYFTEAQRYAMLTAAKIAGLNCLRLINETTATALAYGIYKTDLPETDPVHVAFVDFGHSSTQVCIVAFKKGQLEVKAHNWDRNLGGRDFDEVLFNHFCDEFKEKYKLDIKSNAKACFRLRNSLDKVKKILSSNPEAPVNIECIMEDTDVRGHMTRDKFMELAQPLLDRVPPILQKAIETSGLTTDQISQVEMVGSCGRIPAMAKFISDVFKKDPSTTQHLKECVAKGCALQCAMLSPIFRVRDFDVKDICPFGVTISYPTLGEKENSVKEIFPPNKIIPSTISLKVKQNKAFKVAARYSDAAGPMLPQGQDLAIGEFSVAKLQLPKGEDSALVKITLRLNLHGLLTVGFQLVRKQVVEEKVPIETDKAGAAPAGEQPAADGAADNGQAAAEVSEEAKADGAAGAAPMEVDGQKYKIEKKEKTILEELKATVVSKELNEQQMNTLLEQEGMMAANDKLQEETAEQKNALEAYALELRRKLFDDFNNYIKEEDRSQLSKKLDQLEDWLYEEGEDQTKSVYHDRLLQLRQEGDPIALRFQEDQTRQPAISQLQQTCRAYIEMAQSTSHQYVHIEQEEKQKVMDECQAALSWLSEKNTIQKELPKHEPPALLTNDIFKRLQTIDTFCKPIMSKPVPPPPKKEEAKQAEPKPAEAAPEAPKEEPMPEEKAAEDTPMES